MNGLQEILLAFCLVLMVLTFFAWREVWGLLGGYGKGIWCESSFYLREARKDRVHVTFATIIMWALFFLASFS